MHSKSDNKEIMINYKAEKLLKNILNQSFIDIKVSWKN